MNFELNEEQRAWQAKARRFAQEEIRPVSLQREQIADPAKTWDWDLIKKGSRLGFRTAAVPKAWGGAGIDFVTQALVIAELAKADSAVSKAFSQNWKWGRLIADCCTDEQKERFLKPFVSDDTYMLASSSTEPNAGSDNRLPPEEDPRAGFKLKAERRGNEWFLNGEKCFTANGSVAKLYLVQTRTNPNVSTRQGTTVFLVPRDTPGFRVGKVFDKSGWRFYQNSELIFEDARVPHINIVGEVNGGAKVRGGAAAEFSDLELASNALGVCDDACESAVRHAKARKQGGKPLIDQQIIQLKLARMHMLTEALRSFVLRAAWEMDRAMHGSSSVAFLMNFSTDVIQQVSALSMDVHGAVGHTMNAFADKRVRDSMIWSHLAGDSTLRMRAIQRVLKQAAG